MRWADAGAEPSAAEPGPIVLMRGGMHGHPQKPCAPRSSHRCAGDGKALASDADAGSLTEHLFREQLARAGGRGAGPHVPRACADVTMYLHREVLHLDRVPWRRVQDLTVPTPDYFVDTTAVPGVHRSAKEMVHSVQ